MGTRPDASTADDSGSALVDFVLVGGLLALIFMSIVQLALVLHIRNTLIDAAASGARYGTLADRGAADAKLRAAELISSSLNSDFSRDVSVQSVVNDGIAMLEVTVRAPIPAVGLAGPVGELEVRGHAPVRP